MTDNITLQWCLMFFILGILLGILLGAMFWIWLDEHYEKILILLDEHYEKKKRKKGSSNATDQQGDAKDL